MLAEKASTEVLQFPIKANCQISHVTTKNRKIAIIACLKTKARSTEQYCQIYQMKMQKTHCNLKFKHKCRSCILPGHSCTEDHGKESFCLSERKPAAATCINQGLWQKHEIVSIPAQEDLIVALDKYCCIFPSLEMCFSRFSLSVSIIVYQVRVWRMQVTCLFISRWSVHEGPFPDLMKSITQSPNTLSFEWDIKTGRIVVVSIRNRVWVVYM